MSIISIRKANNSEFDLFYDLFEKSLTELFSYYTPLSISYLTEVDYSREWVRERVDKGKKVIFLALDKNELVGYFLVSKPSAGVSLGDWLAVEKNYQKQGIATNLIKEWEWYALDKGAHALMFWTAESNILFYKNRGFDLAGKFPNAWYGLDRQLMYKTLREPKEENYFKDFLCSRSS